MSDRMRWRGRDTNPVVAAVDSATVIETGDLVWQDMDADCAYKVARPASQLRVAPDLQLMFVELFLGVAMQRSRSGDTAPVRVATTGLFQLDCVTASFELGDLIGVYGLQGSGGSNCKYLQNQMVKKVNDRRYAIARVAKQETKPADSVLVDIRSSVMTGGIIGSGPTGV